MEREKDPKDQMLLPVVLVAGTLHQEKARALGKPAILAGTQERFLLKKQRVSKPPDRTLPRELIQQFTDHDRRDRAEGKARRLKEEEEVKAREEARKENSQKVSRAIHEKTVLYSPAMGGRKR